MSPTELARLTPQERLDLIGQLWDSLADDDVAPTPAQRAELDRRLAALRAEPGNSVSWASLRAELRRPR